MPNAYANKKDESKVPNNVSASVPSVNRIKLNYPK